MSSCSQQAFSEVTAAQWECIKAAVQQKTGVVIPGDSGTVTQSGFSVTWTYNPQSLALTIQVTDKPFIISCSAVESTISDIVNGCQ